MALLEIDSVSCTLSHTFVRNFLCRVNLSLQPFHSESVKAPVTLELLTGELREALKHQVWTIHGLTFLQGLFPSGPKESSGWSIRISLSGLLTSAVDVSRLTEQRVGVNEGGGSFTGWAWIRTLLESTNWRSSSEHLSKALLGFPFAWEDIFRNSPFLAYHIVLVWGIWCDLG